MVTCKRTDRSERRGSGVAESSRAFWDEYRAKLHEVIQAMRTKLELHSNH